MDILFCTNADAAESEEWLAALRVELPDVRWYLPGSSPPATDIEIAVVANPPKGSLQGLPGLRLIQSLWAGVDRLLDDPSLPAGVPIARMVDPAMNAAMAETALWATLGLHRHYFAYSRAQREGRWQQLPQRRPQEVAVAVLGMGQMGRTAALRIAANGYAVTGWNQTPRVADDAISSAYGLAALPALLAANDIVINLLPLTDSTRGLLDARFFSAMRPGAGLVNLARGAHVVDTDLLAALDIGQIAHAVLDVFVEEPLHARHPYWQHPAVTVLPHVAALTDVRSAAAQVAANIRAAAAGEAVANLVDRDRGY